ncbi:MAG: sensor histidine kinase [Oscillospiraceae bacterium]|nr:sensor histidine kinase [Oscillospiraceae bacterium]
MTVAVFEELRFVWELLAAEFVLLLPFAQQRKNFVFRVVVCWLVMSLLSQGYFLILQMDSLLQNNVFRCLVGGWYVVLTLLTIGVSLWCFRLTFTDALFICISGYAMQHIVYILIHELLALHLWKELTQNLLLYVLVSLGASVVVFGLFWRLFAKKLALCEGRIMPGMAQGVFFQVMMLIGLIFCTFACQTFFWNAPGLELQAVQLGLVVCLMILGLEHGTLNVILARKEQTVIEQILQNSARQYALSKEMVDHINRTCHDLKHNLQVLKTIDAGQRRAYIEEAERNIARYHELVHCDDEVLNTILGEKCLFCSHRDIRLSCAVDGGNLSFVSTPDLYALLGNAIDNAIECVDRFDDPEKRVISLTITTHNAFTCIQTNNYCEDTPEMADGLPVTTKGKPGQRGFGLKSIRYLAEKYGGSMAVDLRDHIFTLQIILPVNQTTTPL